MATWKVRRLMRVIVRTLAVCVSMCLLGTARNAAASIIDAATFGGHQYYLLDLSSWGDAEAEAVTLGGHLATIDDASEQAFVTERFGVATGLFALHQTLWIGLSDHLDEGVFRWASGAPLGYTNWGAGEPNDCHLVARECISEDFVHIGWWGPEGPWNDLADVFDNYGVVEVDNAVPEPTTLAMLSLGLAAFARRARRDD